LKEEENDLIHPPWIKRLVLEGQKKQHTLSVVVVDRGMMKLMKCTEMM
jgi:hypothetical protein